MNKYLRNKCTTLRQKLQQHRRKSNVDIQIYRKQIGTSTHTHTHLRRINVSFMCKCVVKYCLSPFPFYVLIIISTENKRNSASCDHANCLSRLNNHRGSDGCCGVFLVTKQSLENFQFLAE